jgi:hypothetical protein
MEREEITSNILMECLTGSDTVRVRACGLDSPG